MTNKLLYMFPNLALDTWAAIASPATLDPFVSLKMLGRIHRRAPSNAKTMAFAAKEPRT